MASNGRGGSRRRRFASKDALGPIDHVAISNLLTCLAPNAPTVRKIFAASIVFRGIEIFRENAPNERALKGTIQASRRALQRFQNGAAPFNSFAKIGGRIVGAASDGLYWVDTSGCRQVDEYSGLEKSLADPLRDASAIAQLAAGVKRSDPGVAFNPFTVGSDGESGTLGEVLLDEFARPRDWDAELAGYVYLSITHGLLIDASMGWYDTKPIRTGAGWNYGRLLEVAARQSGMTLPRSRSGMEGLMSRGRDSAAEILAPAITYADGRTFSHFDIEFPEN